jgi:hypothetical protein
MPASQAGTSAVGIRCCDVWKFELIEPMNVSGESGPGATCAGPYRCFSTETPRLGGQARLPGAAGPQFLTSLYSG